MLSFSSTLRDRARVAYALALSVFAALAAAPPAYAGDAAVLTLGAPASDPGNTFAGAPTSSDGAGSVMQAPATSPTGQVVGYFETYRGISAIQDIPWQNITRLNVAFIGIDGSGRAVWLDTDGNNAPDTSGSAVQVVRALVAARDQNNPNVKLLLSVGGATMSNRFSKAASSQESRQSLASSAVLVMHTLQLDGIDYDWEYPGRLGYNNCEGGKNACQSDDDYQNFTSLLQQTRNLLTADQLLTVAVYYDPSDSGVPYQVASMDKVLDAFNVMAYDMAAPNWVSQTAFHAGIQASEDSLDNFVKQGATASKMVLGVPLYGYIWQQVPYAGVNVTPTANQGKNAGTQYAIQDLYTRYANDAGCKLYEVADGDYYYCTSGAHVGEWCAIDSVRVVQEKGRFVAANGYGGLMSWALYMDTDSHLLTRTMQQSVTAKIPK